MALVHCECVLNCYEILHCMHQFLKTPVKYLSSMIANAWQWAASKGKVYTHPVNKAEYIDIDVDSCREKQTQSLLSLAFPWRTACLVSCGCDDTCCLVKFCHYSSLNLDDFDCKFLAYIN